MRQFHDAISGSPPRVRGKLCLHFSKLPDCRITPACAGKTTKRCYKQGQLTDHPRVCGENKELKVTYYRAEGSPPRVRGKLHFPASAFLPTRITPACAGKTFLIHGSGIQSSDHPRVCGENLLSSPTVIRAAGSPPRVRGKQPPKPQRVDAERITPACAGKTPARPCPPSRPADHPRVCGENSFLHLYAPPCHGSPPRVRGKPTID